MMKQWSRLLIIAALMSGCATRPPSLDLGRATIVDLTHSLDERTLFWPSETAAFELKKLSWGTTPGGYFYSSFAFCTPEHGGTHVDAPIHFSETGRTVDQIPLRDLIAPAVVIDITDQAARDRDYRLTADDVRQWERRHGRIDPGTIVIVRTGWGERWGDRLRYFGDDRPGVTAGLHFPSYGEEAARLLVDERRVAALGIDTASIDYGQSRDFIVHRIAAEANVTGLENVANVEQLPPRGFWIAALPLKIAGGSGGPVRIVALLPE
jgi:kynurenine formamidase